MRLLILITFLLNSLCNEAQVDFPEQNISINPFIEGTLLKTSKETTSDLVIFIGGSGPTDRDGNQPMMKNNAFKFLSQALFNYGISSFRYDKRVVKALKNGQFDESSARFDDFINDAKDVIDFFALAPDFERLIILGHSQGSLVGMLAAKGKADAFISIAGAGQEIDDVIIDQLNWQAPQLSDAARQAFDDLRTNGTVQSYPQALASIFRPSLQGFIANWMTYDPQKAISDLEMPILIVNGTRDMQVQTTEAELLKTKAPNAKLLLVPNMNHVLKLVPGNGLDNSKTYDDPNIPIAPELVEGIVSFLDH
ncbi:MAG: alpha/beta hydrolase [Flavobacteriaceae bacterium]|nr:alpha/beta hydrolase [Flavobacteriaceae bacterium]MDG1962021.1 alpha/beta hydrolase [Flavobacteriaceae bacterium]